MDKNSNAFWWRELEGGERDLRDLLWEIVCKLGQTSPLGYFQWKDSSSRPFENKFRKNGTRTIFTQRIIGHILECIYGYADAYKNSNIYEEIEKILPESKIEIAESETIKKDEESKKKCAPFLCANGGYRECTDECFAHRLIKRLLEIQRDNDEKILNGATDVGSEYKCEEDKQRVARIYEYISDYEKNFDETKELLDTTSTLFNYCIECLDIQDVVDENLAYIKWYTARLQTWPFFRAYLQNSECYDERIVFQLLNSASNILLHISPENTSLWTDIQVDRLTSYISLACVVPFNFPNITHEGVTKEMIKLKLYDLKPEYQIKILPTLWMLSHCIGDDDCKEYENKLNEYCDTFKEDNWLLYTEYNLYRYIYDGGKDDHDCAQKCLKQMFDKDQDHVDTALSLRYLYYNYHIYNYKYESYNLAGDIIDTCGTMEDRLPYCRPSLYKRPIYDVGILEFFCNDAEVFLNQKHTE